MVQELKKQLLEDPENICTLLEEFEFEHITLKRNEIRFARNSEGGQNIRIRLENNDYLNVTDYARSEHCDIVSYIIKEKHTGFRTVLTAIKKILHLSDDWRPQNGKREIFGGVYSRIINKTKPQPKTYPEEILNEYMPVGNMLWLRDGISLETQRFYDVCFDIENNGIVFPWRNEHGDIIAIKSRYNGMPPEGISKYYFPIGGNISSSLYNYSQCYQYLYGNDVIIVESEKACMQAYTMGYKNVVGLGSNSLSEDQAKLIIQLQPRRIVMALDEGLEFEQTVKNIKLLKSLAVMRELKIFYWDSAMDIDIPLKASPTDMGKEKFEEIMREQIVEYDDLEDEL